MTPDPPPPFYSAVCFTAGGLLIGLLIGWYLYAWFHRKNIAACRAVCAQAEICVATLEALKRSCEKRAGEPGRMTAIRNGIVTAGEQAIPAVKP